MTNGKLIRGGAALALSLIVLLSSCISLRDQDGTETRGGETKAETSSDSRTDASGGHASSSDMTSETQDKVRGDETSESLDEIEPNDPYMGVNIRFVAAGDNLIHPNIYIDAGMRAAADSDPDNEYDFLPMYSEVSDFIANADIAFINQETVMAGAEYGYSGWPCFNAPRQLGIDLVTLGFDIVNIANNHMLDKGTSGLKSTIEFWNSEPVTLLGGYLDEEDSHTVRVVEKDGVKIAFLSYTYGTNGIVKDPASPLVVPYIDDSVILSDMEKARALGDILIVSIHWGDENTQTPNAEQYRLAKMISEAGADVILGHHSHTLQPIEWIDNGNGGRTLCIYSLGNFVSGMARPVNQVGGFLSFTICSDGEGGLMIDSPEFTPTVFYYGMDWYGTHLYFLENYTSDIASRHGVQISGYTLSPDDAKAFVTNVMTEEFLPSWMKS